MPTPSGRLRAGDRLVWQGTLAAGVDLTLAGVVFVVQERTGNDQAYGVWFRREDGKPFPWAGARRDHGREALLTEAHYHVFSVRGGWRLLPPGQPARRGGPLARSGHGQYRRPAGDPPSGDVIQVVWPAHLEPQLRACSPRPACTCSGSRRKTTTCRPTGSPGHDRPLKEETHDAHTR